jgi:NDP-sugar pyrophosphorylase family protein
VLVDRDSHAPASAVPHEACHVSITRDAAEYRGTGGVLRDLAEEYDDDDFILVANGAQILTAPLADMVGQLYETESDVSFVAHEDGTPSGLMLIRCEALRMISAKTYVDMKEQALPVIAQRFKVTHIDHRRSTGMPLRSHQDYLAGLRWWHFNRLLQSGTHADVLRRTDFSRPNYSSSFSIIEPGAIVAPGACLHDCVVLRGAHIGSGAVAVRCVVCPGGVLAPDESAVDQLITATSRARARLNRGLQPI